MKINTLYLLFFLAFASFVLTSRSGGPAAVLPADRTGSPFGSGTCQGCHSAGAFNPMISILLLDGTDTITAYEPNKTYTLQVINTAEAGAAGYGMQAVAVSGDDNVNSGNFGTPENGTQITSLGGRDYFEHNTLNSDSLFQIEWTAPDINTGDVTFYAASIAANGNGSLSGDGTVAGTLELTERVLSSTTDRQLDVDVQVFPNPVSDVVSLQLNATSRQLTRLRLFNLEGKLLQSEVLDLTVGSNTHQLNVQHLPKGQYLLQLTDSGKTVTKKLLKI
ncbi:MAG: choice-of-anchor V domain-containing protein [Bacteroidota bacterium]